MEKALTILLADDDADDRDLFLEAIKETNQEFDCVAVEDGQQAIQYLSDLANPIPDYVFLDLRMPRMSGSTCLQLIRSDERLRQIPVIIYTTSDYVEDSKELINTGATHFITKPANPEEIYYILSMILNEKWN